jgi:ATP-dependent RNA helicase DDX35
LKALGIDDVLHFDFMAPPPAELMIKALELLYATGALDGACKLTHPVGTTLAEFPVEPQLGRMVLYPHPLSFLDSLVSLADSFVCMYVCMAS